MAPSIAVVGSMPLGFSIAAFPQIVIAPTPTLIY